MAVLTTMATAHGTAEAEAAAVADQVGLLRLLGAGLLGALLVKVLEIGYQEVRRGSERRRTARRFVDEHLDPVLKVADELVGKLRSLAMADFKTLRARHGSHERNHDLVDVLYLMARLWASLELFRGGGQTVSVVRDTRGKRLAAFADCLESRRVRIVRRSSQRAVAELALVPGDGGVAASAQTSSVGSVTLWDAELAVGTTDAGDTWHVGHRESPELGSLSSGEFSADGAGVEVTDLYYETGEHSESAASARLLFYASADGPFPTDKTDCRRAALQDALQFCRVDNQQTRQGPCFPLSC